jgi:hypothetical protein
MPDEFDRVRQSVSDDDYHVNSHDDSAFEVLQSKMLPHRLYYEEKKIGSSVIFSAFSQKKHFIFHFVVRPFHR